MASASIAQVHKGVLKSGETVAIKVQKPNIRRQFYWDMKMHYLFCYVIDKLFDLPILFMADSIEKNLEYEIDFNHESEN